MMMKSTVLALALSLSFTAMAESTPTAAPIGFVKTVAGDASVSSQGKSEKANIGTPVFTGSILKTEAGASMGVIFRDETVMSFGPNTEFAVDEYLYAPSQGKLKLASKMTKGSMNYVSGVIAKLEPESVSVKTPTGMIGIRGTNFLVKVED